MIKSLLHTLVSLLCLLIVVNSFAQQRFFPMQHFYKDRLFHYVLSDTQDSISGMTTHTTFSYTGSSFFPETEQNTYRLRQLSNDDKQRKWVGRKLFQEHFFEIKGKDYFITIDPIVDFSIGRDLRDVQTVNYYQNTRGIEIKGDILDNISFFTNIRENQQRFVGYQTDYIEKHGEYYPGANGYAQQNGVIPGAARTKPFKDGGFDFAYVTGAITYRPFKQIGISMGNNMHFVGAGYRSVLLSDHSANAPYARVSYQINEKLSGEVVYSQQLNLLRTEIQTEGTERFYEKKGFTVHYFTYKPIRNISISLFESTVWDRGDSTEIRRVNGWYYNPVPIVNTAVLGTKGNRTNTLLGLNVLAKLPINMHLYGQFALDDFSQLTPAYQLGFRWSQPFNVRDLFLQGEFNAVPKGFYSHPNSRLNFTHNNLPLMHPFGSGFNELVGRLSYEWKRIGIATRTNMYFTRLDPVSSQYGEQLYVVPIGFSGVEEKGKILIQQIDLTYRFNRMNNLQMFATLLYRTTRFPSQANETFYVGFGLRTQLSNHYFDF